MKSSIQRTIFLAPVIVKYMEKNFDITKPRYGVDLIFIASSLELRHIEALQL